MKKIQVAVLLMLSLCPITMYAAQASQPDVGHGRQTMIDNAVKNFSYLTDGFDFLQTQGVVDTSFHDFLEQNVSHDEDGNEDMNFDQVILDAEDVLTDNMKDKFLQRLDTAIKEKRNLGEFHDPLFLYVMQHKDDDMRDIVRLWIYEWKNIKNKWNRSPLHCAVSTDNLEIVSMLIAVGADVNSQDEFGRTPLHRAVSNDNLEIVSMLIAVGADVNSQDGFGLTPLHGTFLNDNVEIVGMLIDAGADISMKNKLGHTPLCSAIFNNSVEIIKALIAAEVDVNIQNENGKTPLYEAVFSNSIEIVGMLIDAGADVNIQDGFGLTPLHVTAHFSNVKIASMLITARANLYIKNKRGETAEQRARTPEMKVFFAQAREKQQEKVDEQAMARFEKMIRKDWR